MACHSTQSVRTDLSNQRLALGTVQFGLPYGVANQSCMVTFEEATAIVRRAREAGVDTLDTAIAYGESEQRLGQIGVREWKVVSKLPAVQEDQEDVVSWVRTAVAGSLGRLGLQCLHGILLHRPSDLLGPHGVELYQALLSLKEEGLVEAIGVSLYGPDELEALWGGFTFDLVQTPYNVLDHRIVTSGWLSRLWDAGVTVHARSAFLQGLLLMPRTALPEWSRRWDGLWDCWYDWLDSEDLPALEACLGFALAEPRLERVVVGVDNLQQFNELLSGVEGTTSIPPKALTTEDLDLIDPSRWAKT